MPQQEQQPGEPLGGLTDVKVNGDRNDVVIYRTGLLLLTDRSHSDPKRLRAVLDGTPVRELFGRNRFVPFTEVSHARIVKPGVRCKVSLDLTGGEQLDIAEGWTSTSLGDDDGALLQEVLTGLRDRGPMPEPAAAEAARAWAEDAEVLDGLSNMVVNGIGYDLLVLDIGFVLVADPGGFEHGEKRLAALTHHTPLFEVIGRNWLVRYEQVVAAAISRAVPVTAEIELYDGLRLAITEGRYIQTLTDDARDVLTAALCSVGATQPWLPGNPAVLH